MLDSIGIHNITHGQLHDRFVQNAALMPDHVALQYEGTCLSYRILDRRSNQLARVLRQRGLQPRMFAGICLERSPDLIIAILAVLKAGGVYVPIDPGYPADRRGFILHDSRVSLLITRGALAINTQPSAKIFDIDQEAAHIDATAHIPLPEHHTIAPENLACLFYTSGSTGRPKAVMLRHDATRMIAWADQTLPAGALDCVAATTSICFDPSIFEIFAPLSLGGRILLKRDLLQPFGADEYPTLLNGVPSAFAELARGRHIPQSVRVINIGGERLRADLARTLYRCAKIDQIWNHYGPTETTICASAALVSPSATDDPPIGQPIAGALLYVLDDQRAPTKPGVVGELFIGGPNVAAGYLNQPHMTADVFLPDPFVPGGRMYRTGDLAKRAESGDLIFAGRIGRQVKIRGFRIELDEIETALISCPGVSHAAVTPIKRHDGADYLCAFIVTHDATDLAALRQALRDSLPHYMLPSRFVVLPHLPLSPSGKVDYAALTARDLTESGPAAAAASHLEDHFAAAIVDIYRQLLEQDSFGPDDDFFDGGGDSLMALAATEFLQDLLGLAMPVSMLYHGRTANKLAALISDQRTTSSSHIVTLQSGGSGTPIFCLPDIYGRPTSCISLARHFAGDRPVYGLAVGPAEAAFIANPDIAILTACYKTAIQALRPQGPIIILGYSAAGTPAIDLANALQAAGRHVTLVLLDPRAQRFLSDLPFKRTQLRRALSATWRQGPRAGIKAFFRHPPPQWVPSAYAALTMASLDAEAAWRGEAFSGQSILVRCPDPGGRPTKLLNRIARLCRPGQHGWQRHLRGPSIMHHINVEHVALMREPFVATLAHWLISTAQL